MTRSSIIRGYTDAIDMLIIKAESCVATRQYELSGKCMRIANYLRLQRDGQLMVRWANGE